MTLFIVLPLAIFSWIIGWSLYWVGDKKHKVYQKPAHEHADLAFTVIPPERKYAF